MRTTLSFIGIIALLLSVTSCGSKSNESKNEFKYLAVKLDKGDNWSIMNDKGEIVVKDEYAPDDEISAITSEGLYWVCSGVDNKYRLYSVESPKKPITSAEYEYVTAFLNGKAYVSDGTNPIQLVNTDGDAIKTLDKTIRKVVISPNSCDRAIYYDNTGKAGYLDGNGNIAIQAQYYDANPFSCGVALVEKENSDTLIIIDDKGNEKGIIDTNRYKPCLHSFYEDKLAVVDKDNDNDLIYINAEGKPAMKTAKKCYKPSYIDNCIFLDGYAIVNSADKESVGIIDDKGENVIRFGKYYALYNMGEGKFLAVKKKGSDYKCGIIDSQDNTLIEFDYDRFEPLKLGNNFVLGANSYMLLVAPDGEEVKKSEFYRASYSRTTFAEYFDLEQIAKDLVAQIEPSGFTPALGKKTIAEVAQAYNLNPESTHKWRKYLSLDNFKADVYDVSASMSFSNTIVVEKTHTETVNDGWFSYNKTVSDGYAWNNEAVLEVITLYVPNLNRSIDTEKIKSIAGDMLIQKGFKAVGDGPVYEAKNGDRYARVSMTAGEKEFTLWFYPYSSSSEEMVDND